jgi:hypothetical protein
MVALQGVCRACWHSPACQTSQWVSLRCGGVSIGIDPAAAQDPAFIVGIFATSALNGESDCTNAC